MLCFKVMALRKSAHNFVFSKGQACSQKNFRQIVVNANVKHFHLVKHSTAASFSIKTIFYETNNIYYRK